MRADELLFALAQFLGMLLGRAVRGRALLSKNVEAEFLTTNPHSAHPEWYRVRRAIGRVLFDMSGRAARVAGKVPPRPAKRFGE
jgi:hypothetical protein